MPGVALRPDVRLPAPAARRRPGRPSRRREAGREADGRGGHRRVRAGRDRRSPALLTTGGHRVIRLVRRPARSKDERQWQPDAPATRPAVRGRRSDTPGGRVDRGALHRGAQGGDPRQPHRADSPARAGGGRQRRRPADVRQRVGGRHLRVRPRRRAAVRGKRARRWVPRRRGRRLGGRDPARRRRRPARGHRAHRDRAGRGGRNAAAAAAALPRRPRRPDGQRQAVAVVDRP